MVLKLMLSKHYPLVTGQRKSDGAEYAVRDVEFVLYDGKNEVDRFVVRMSGDNARNAEKQIVAGVSYYVDIKFDVNDFTSQDGRHFPRQNNWVRNFWTAEQNSQQAENNPPYEPFDQPY